MRNLILTALIAGTAIACTTGPEAAKAEVADHHKSDATTLDTVLAASIRDQDRARDQYRHPKETLTFFQVEPGMTVAEYAPGGGWYTRVLAPLVVEKGRYIGLGVSAENLPFPEDRKTSFRRFGETFPTEAAGDTGLPAGKITAFTPLTAPADMKGKVDRILVIRMMHNIKRWGVAGSEFDAMRDLLKDDGMIGIVQHRAKADAPDAYVDGSKGYLKQADVIAFMEEHGFELAGTSEVNANPKDTADYPNGVWTLPPSLALKDQERDKYTAIGESDRMTLLFKKKG